MLKNTAHIINKILQINFETKKPEQIGLSEHKKDFFKAIKNTNQDLYEYLSDEEFQEWFTIIKQMRHKSAHQNLILTTPFLSQTEKSKMSDEEIDVILYKNKPVVDSRLAEMLGKKFIEEKKGTDRYKYRLKHMNKELDYFGQIELDGKVWTFDPIARITIDKENTYKLIEKISILYDDQEKLVP